jgi:hypothetical protein
MGASLPLRVKNSAHLVGNEVVVTGDRPGDFAAILTNLDPVPGSDGPSWTMPLKIGEGVSARDVLITLVPFISQADYEISLKEPILIKSAQSASRQSSGTIAIFRNHFFVPDRDPRNEDEREELALRVKRAVYKEEEELSSLKSYVSNMEAALEYHRNGPQRIAIPDDVRIVVWARDGGACVRCGSRERLHFDHIIPVVKGGGNDVKNIQILCEPCNLRKSDKIGL